MTLLSPERHLLFSESFSVHFNKNHFPLQVQEYNEDTSAPLEQGSPQQRSAHTARTRILRTAGIR